MPNYKFNKEGERALSLIAAMTSRDNNQDVIRDAINVYEMLMDQVMRKGNKIFIGKDRDTATETEITTFL